MSLSKRNVVIQTVAYIFKGVLFHQVADIDIESIQNRLLEVCYVPATRASLPRLLFFSFFVAATINSTNEANKAGSMCH
jgi:hypothetical protein